MSAKHSPLHWALALSVVATNIAIVQPARSLPDDRVMERLRFVPVFTIGNRTGNLLLDTIQVPGPNNQQQNRQVINIFVSRQDATNAIQQQIQRANPALARDLQVLPSSLGAIYGEMQKSRTQPTAPVFRFVPQQRQVTNALNILRQQNINPSSFRGNVPLFFVSAGAQPSYVTAEIRSVKKIPYYFDLEQAQQLSDKFKRQNPSLAATVKINVVSLEGLLAQFAQANDSATAQMTIEPSTEGVAVLNTLPTTAPSGSPSATPSRVPNPILPPTRPVLPPR
jgi:hypothetical protein